MSREYRLVSADSHLEISPERWTPRVAARYRDRAPRLIHLANGSNGLIIENRPLYVVGLDLSGKPYEEHSIKDAVFQGSPGTGSPEQRLREQDADRVDAEVLFTTPPNHNFWRGIRDDEAYLTVVHAYNEFLAEEYCAAAPDRLIGMGAIPMLSVEAALAELEYCARSGLKGVALNAFPNGKACPVPEDDRFWSAALDLNMALTIHASFIGPEGPTFRYPRHPGEAGFGSDPVTLLMRFGGGHTKPAIQMMFAGVFDRFPTLRIFSAETMIGWVPYALEQIDDTYERSQHWIERLYGLEPLPQPPSNFIRQHCIWGFLRDRYGVRHRHEIGLENIMWGSDFPHAAGNWPHSREVLDEMFAGVPQAEHRQITCENAVEFFHLKADRPQPSVVRAGAEGMHRWVTSQP